MSFSWELKIFPGWLLKVTKAPLHWSILSQLPVKLPHYPCELKKEGPVCIVGKKERERKEDFQGKSPKRDLNKEA